MKNEINELYGLVNELMRANSVGDGTTFETIKQTLEKKTGKELDNTKDTKISKGLLNNYKEAYLEALQGDATWDMMMTIANISKQSEGDYTALQTKYMNEVQSLFIAMLKDKNDDKKEIYAEMQDALDETGEDDRS